MTTPENRRIGVDSNIFQASTIRGYDSPLAANPPGDLLLTTGRNTSTGVVSQLVLWNRTDVVWPVFVLAAGGNLNTALRAEVYLGNLGDPNGAVTATSGSLYISKTGPGVFQNQDGGTVWKSISNDLGGEDLAETLAIGNTTGGHDIIVSSGDFIRGAPSATTTGGALSLIGGSSSALVGAGGNVVVQGGTAIGGSSGSVQISTPAPAGTNNSGLIFLSTGDTLTGGSAGTVTLQGGRSGAANVVGFGGSLLLLGGESLTTGATPARAGSVTVRGGKSQPDSEGGSMWFWAGDSAVTGITPFVLPPVAGKGGDVNFRAGNSSKAISGGSVVIQAGTGGSSGGVGGNVLLTPGAGGGGANAGEVVAGGVFRASNLKRGDGNPNTLGTTGDEGDLFQRYSAGQGEMWLNSNGTQTGWQRLAFASDFISVFSKIQFGQITPVLDKLGGGIEAAFSDTGVYEGLSPYSVFNAGFAPDITRGADNFGPYAQFQPNGQNNDVGIEVASNSTGIRVEQRFVAVFKITNTSNANSWRATIGLSSGSAANALSSDSPAGENIFLQKASGSNNWRLFTSGTGGPNPLALNAAAGNITSSQNNARYVVLDTTIASTLKVSIFNEDFELLDEKTVTDTTLFPQGTTNLYPIVAIRQTGAVVFPYLKLWAATVIVEADKLLLAAAATTPKPTLEQVLLTGNTTGSTPIEISEGSGVLGETDGGVGSGTAVQIRSGGTLLAGNQTGNLIFWSADHAVPNATNKTGDVLLRSGAQIGNNTIGNSGDVVLRSGEIAVASGTGSTGAVQIASGSHVGVGGSTGSILVASGGHNGTGGTVGDILLLPGGTLPGAVTPGNLILQGGSTSLNGTPGGSVLITSGASGSTGDTGLLQLGTPNVDLSGFAGNVDVVVGDGGTNDGEGGSFRVFAGDAAGAGPNAKGGRVVLQAGNGIVAGGNIDITAGDSTVLDGGSIAIVAGNQLGGGIGGSIVLQPGTGGTDGEVLVNGKLTVTGLIDPTGLVLDGQNSAPYAPPVTQGVIWVDKLDSDKLKFTNSGGTIDLGSGGAVALTDLTDVNIVAPIAGDVLQFDGVIWKNLAGAGAPLATVLTLGNATGAHDIVVNTGQALRGQTDLTLEPGAGVGDQIVLNGLRWPTVDGLAGNVLVTDGLGNLSFAPGGGGGSGSFAEAFAQMQWGSLQPPPDGMGLSDLNGSGILHNSSDTSPGVGGGTAADGHGLYRTMVSLTAAAEAGTISTTQPTTLDARFLHITKIRVSKTADVRFFVGVTTGTRTDMAFSDAPATALGGYIGVGFSTALGETDFQWIHNSGPGLGTRTPSGVAADTAVHYISIDASTAGQVVFTIYDGDFVSQATSTVAANLPLGTMNLDSVVVVLSTVAPDASMDVFSVALINRADLLVGLGGGGSQTLAQVLTLGNATGGTPIQGDDNSGGSGSNLELWGGTSTGGGGSGGEVRLVSGAPDPGGNGSGGVLRMTSAAGSGSGAGGHLLMTLGSGGLANGDGGGWVFSLGAGQGTGAGGAITWTTGDGGSGGGTPGGWSVTLGNATGGNTAAPINVFSAGAGFGTGNGGMWSLVGGPGGLAGGDGGSIFLTPGLGNGGGTNGVVLVTGDCEITGKLTVGGMIDPPGLLMSSSLIRPFTPVGTEGGIWVNASGELIYSNAGTDLNISTGIGGGMSFLDGLLIAGYGFLSPGTPLSFPSSSGIFGGSSYQSTVGGATITYDTDDNGPFLQLSTAAVPGSEVVVGTNDSIVRRDQKFKAVIKFRITSPVHTDERFFAGFTDDVLTQLSSDDPVTNQYVGVLESLAGSNLEFVARGTGGAMVPVFGIPVDGFVHYLVLDAIDPAQFTFTLLAADGVTVQATHTEPASNLLPGTTKNLQTMVGTHTAVGAVRDCDFYMATAIARADIVDAVVGGGGGGVTQNLSSVLTIGNMSGGIPIQGDDNGAGSGGSLELFGGSSTGGGGNGGDLFLRGGAADGAGTSGSIFASTIAAAQAGGITIAAGDSSATSGSDLDLIAGGTTALGQPGGTVTLSGGSSTTGAGGDVEISGGFAAAGPGGSIQISASPGTGGSAGGSVSVSAGDGDGANAGGDLLLAAGNGGGGGGTKGGVQLFAGGASTPLPFEGRVLAVGSPTANAVGATLLIDRAVPTDAGHAYLIGGSGIGGAVQGGNVTLNAGQGSGGSLAGTVFLLGSGASAPTGVEGGVALVSHPEAGVASGSQILAYPATPSFGGSLLVQGGSADPATNALGGSIEIIGGAGDGVGAGGSLMLNGGSSQSVQGGSILAEAGYTAMAGVRGGDISIAGGGGISTSIGGRAFLRGADIGTSSPLLVASSNGQGGHTFVLAGASDGSASGGNVYIYGGQSGPSASFGGSVVVGAGSGRTGSGAAGGTLTLSGGAGGSGGSAGGDVLIQGGNAGGGGLNAGGNVVLAPGAGGGVATNGRIRFDGRVATNGSGFQFGTFTIPALGTGPFVITFPTAFVANPRMIQITHEAASAVAGQHLVVVTGTITTLQFQVRSSSAMAAGDKIHWQAILA